MKNLQKNLAGNFMWLVVAVGAAASLYAALNLPPNTIDGYFLLLAIVTAAIGSRIGPRALEPSATRSGFARGLYSGG